MLRTNGERGETFRKLERDAHKWTGDEEADGDVKQVEETCARVQNFWSAGAGATPFWTWKLTLFRRGLFRSSELEVFRKAVVPTVRERNSSKLSTRRDLKRLKPTHSDR